MLLTLKLFLSHAIPWALGYAVLLLLFRKKPLSFVLSIALAYGLGMGLLSQWMLFLQVIGIEYSIYSVAVPLLFATSILVFIAYKKKVPLIKRESGHLFEGNVLDKIFIVLASYVVLYSVYVFWRSTNIPIYTFDAISTVAFKAKVFFYDRSLGGLSHLPYKEYPLHVSLVEAWIALALGQWNDLLIKSYFSFNFLSYLCVQYFFLRHFTTRRWAMFGLFLLVSSRFLILHATIGYRDFTLLSYNCIALMLILLWRRSRDDAFLILAGLFSGFNTFVKMEGFMYLTVHLMVLLLILFKTKETSLKDFSLKVAKFFIPSFGIFLFFLLFKIFSNLQFLHEQAIIVLDFKAWTTLPLAIKNFFYNLFLTNNWNVLWMVLLLSLLNFGNIRESEDIQILLVSLVLFLGSLFALFFFTHFHLQFTVAYARGGLISRLILHYFPIIPMLIVLLNCPPAAVSNKMKDNNR